MTYTVINGSVYGTNYDDTGIVSIVNTSTGRITGTIPGFNIAGEWQIYDSDGIAFAPDGAYAYIANEGNGTVSIVDTHTDKITGIIKGYPGTGVRSPAGIAFAPDGSRAYIADVWNNTVDIVNTSTSTITGTIRGFVSPLSITLAPNGAYAYVTNMGYNGDLCVGTAGCNYVSIVNTSTDTITGKISGFTYGLQTIAIAPSGAYAYATSPAGFVYIVNTSTGKITYIISSGFNSPNGIAFAPNGAYAYVTNRLGNSESIVSTPEVQPINFTAYAAATRQYYTTKTPQTNYGCSPVPCSYTKNGNFTFLFTLPNSTVEAWQFPVTAYDYWLTAPQNISKIAFDNEDFYGRTTCCNLYSSSIAVTDNYGELITPFFFAKVVSSLTEGKTAGQFVAEVQDLNSQLVNYSSAFDNTTIYPAQILAEGHGDSKDKGILLASILEAGNIEANYGMHLQLFYVSAGNLTDPRTIDHMLLAITYANLTAEVLDTTPLLAAPIYLNNTAAPATFSWYQNSGTELALPGSDTFPGFNGTVYGWQYYINWTKGGDPIIPATALKYSSICVPQNGYTCSNLTLSSATGELSVTLSRSLGIWYNTSVAFIPFGASLDQIEPDLNMSQHYHVMYNGSAYHLLIPVAPPGVKPGTIYQGGLWGECGYGCIVNSNGQIRPGSSIAQMAFVYLEATNISQTPSGVTTTILPTITTTTATTTVPQTPSGPFKTVNLGQNLTVGPWTAELGDLGYPNQYGISAASISVYYNGNLTNIAQIEPRTTAKFTVGGSSAYVQVNQTYADPYAYQKWAKMNLSVTQPTIAMPQTNYTMSGPFKTVNLGQNLTAGPWTAELGDLGYPNQYGISAAAIIVYYNGALTNVAQVGPGTTAKFTVGGNSAYVQVNQTFPGYYAYQKWAKIGLSVIPPTIVLPQTNYTASGPFKTVNLGHNLTAGPWTAALTGLNQPNSSGISQARVNIYYEGAQTNSILLNPGTTTKFTVSGSSAYVHLNQTFLGLYSYQKWAKMNLSIPSPVTPQTNQTAPGPFKTVYVLRNLTAGPWTAELSDLGYPNRNGISTASISVYYNGNFTNVAQVSPGTMAKFTVRGSSAYVQVNQTFPGAYVYQAWAKMNLSVTPPATIMPQMNYTFWALSWFDTVYTDHTFFVGLPWAAALIDVTPPNALGISQASMGMYYNGVLVNSTLLNPGTTTKFTFEGNSAYVHLNQTFAGLYANYSYQKWVKMNLTATP
jgi:YVTN family beta-propeller protein